MPKARLLTAVLCCASLAVAAQAQSVFLEGGKLVDPRTDTVSAGNLLIVDGVIAGRPAAPPEGFDGTVLDARGRWIIPGLRDFHTHSMVNIGPGGRVDVIGSGAAATRMLYCGVTGFLDLFNTEDFILGLRDRQRTTDLIPGADMFAAGPCFTATDGHCTEYGVPTRVVDTPEEARREVAELAPKRPDVVKVVYEHAPEELRGESWRPEMPTLTRETLGAVLAAAHEHGLPSVIHIRSWRDIREAVEAGASAVTHLPSWGIVPEDLIALMSERGTVVIPTLAVGDTSMMTEPGYLASPMIQAVAGASILAAYRDYDTETESARSMIDGLAVAQANRFESLRLMVEGGVRVVAGSDSGNNKTLHGVSLHRELALMVEAGLSPWQALAAATTAAGDFVGRSWGLDPGDQGSVVLLDASPIDDIRHTEKIHAVIHHGRQVNRQRLLDEEPAPPRRPGPPEAASPEA